MGPGILGVGNLENTSLKLRPYQNQAIKDLYAYWENNKGVAPLCVLPTGSGKSLVIAEFCRRVCKETPGARIMIVTHSRELVAQNEAELKKCWPEAQTGIYSAGLGEKTLTAQITFAGIQSVYKKIYDFDKIDIAIVDEAHLIPKDANTMYGRFFQDLKIANPLVAIWGCTATPYRLDSGMLHEGEGAIFDGIAHNTDLKELITGGYLVPPISKGGIAKIDLSGVRIQAGEYVPKELEVAADTPDLIRSAVREIIEYGKDRSAWILYCTGVSHAAHVLGAVRSHGIKCELVTGETPTSERDRILGDFKTGKIKCVVNVLVLTTGFNAPVCDLVALLTATKSTGKYIQIVGRGLRTFPGKENCLILDFGGNVERHGPIDAVDPIKRKDILGEVPGAPPQKECPECHAVLYARVAFCPWCQYIFPKNATHEDKSYSGAMLSSQVAIIEVADMFCARHHKTGKPDSVKVSFYDRMEKEYAIWLPLDHGGYAAERGRAIVKQLGGAATTTNGAIQECENWKKPVAIRVIQEGRFPRVTGFVWGDKTTQGGLGA
jgi:DNA repair protein RadD